MEDLKSLGKADPAQIIIAYNANVFRNKLGPAGAAPSSTCL